MTNQDYWAKRTAEREAHWHELTTAELTKLRRYYKSAHKELEREVATLYAKYATENGLSITEARKLIRGDEFKEWRMSLREYVAAAKGDPKLLRELNTLAMRSRISRVEAIHARTLTELIELGNRLQDTTDEHLYRAYLDNYYGTLYDFHRTIGLNTPPAAVDRPRVESVLQTKWSGKNYSARIWTNTRKVATEVQQTILQAIHRGYPIQRLSKNLAQRMNVAYTNAERLILTELNAVEARASADAMKVADFEYYQFVATLDRRTCPICGERDGEVYPLSSMNQGENAPPMDPRCRCTIVAYMEGVGKGSRIAEGRTRISADVSYRQWLKLVAGENESYRHLVPEIPYKPVSEERYNQLIAPLKKMGVTIMRGDADTEKHLNLMGVEASNFGTHIVLFRERVSISAILEETHHIRQNRRGLNDDKAEPLRSWLNEIDAKKYLLRVAGKYGIPREEIEATKIQLEEYEAALRRYDERSGGGNGA